MKKQITAAVLSLGLILPASNAFAYHKHNRLGGTLVGAAAGALITHNAKGALIGAAVGNGVQYARDVHERNNERHYYNRHRHHRYYTNRY